MVNTDTFIGSNASLTFVPELDLSIVLDKSGSENAVTYNGVARTAKTVLTTDALFQAEYLLVPDLYIGCTLDIYDVDASLVNPVSTHTIIGNNTTEIQITPAHTHTVAEASDTAVIRGYGAPCVGDKSSSTSRLNADNWLGLVETGTFPNVEVETKQLNLSLGGSRGWSHQYKGIETASGGNLAFMVNHGAFLYYAFGACSKVKCKFDTTPPASLLTGAATDKVYISTNNASAVSSSTDVTTHNNQGPIFYKTGSGVDSLLPPIDITSDTVAALGTVTLPVAPFNATNGITYTFVEANGEDLPSFALEQSLLKSHSTLTTETADASESQSFIRIARGNRVNSLTMSANENEEVKMTMDLNTRAVHKLTRATDHEARGGQDDNTALFNYSSGTFLEPFFFSSGSFSIFGQQFLKITNLTLTINNNLVDKRYIGSGSKSIKEAIPAQRDYEISFTAMITDDKLFEELFNQTEETSSDTIANGLLNIEFTKPNGEEITLQFKNYFMNQTNITIPEDRGVITVEGMVKPRDLHLCQVKTHWLLQG